MEEPSVLDYVKSLLTPWKGGPIKLPEPEVKQAPVDAGEDRLVGEKSAVEGEASEESAAFAPPSSSAPPGTQPMIASSPVSASQIVDETGKTGEIAPTQAASHWPWFALMVLPVALVAQSSFAPPERSPTLGVGLLLLTVVLVVIANLRDEWDLALWEKRDAGCEPLQERQRDHFTINGASLLVGVVLAGFTFLTSNNNTFSKLNISLLGLSLLAMLHAFWQNWPTLANIQRLGGMLRQREWNLRISRWTLLSLAALALVIFFRFYRLDQIPSEMVSDHAEKYLDVLDILNGSPHIFFPRNGGREALQFYLLAGLHKFFDLALDFRTLKISTTLVGFLALPFVYLLGKEIANRRVGLLAFTFAGVAYWTNVVSRAGMRLPFYFLFSAAVLYYLVRALRSGRRNDFILAGIWLGLSAYGYSADRILPLLVILGVGLFLLHGQSKSFRQQTVWQSIILVLMALVVALPLLRYISQDPQGFAGRMLSRLGPSEVPLPGPVTTIFFKNVWNALRMFSWTDGVVWVTSIPNYPALEVVSGGLFYLGAALALVRYVRRRHWFDLFILFSIPVLMLPSIMALAFPDENPNLYRTGGAMVPVFLLIALALDGLMNSLENHLSRPFGARLAWVTCILLVTAMSLQSYELVFNVYKEQYDLSAWNTSEVGEVIKEFSQTVGSVDTAWLMGYPYWMDTRLIAINAGYPGRDFAIFPEQLPNTLGDSRAKLFILNPQDQVGIDALRQSYPQGWYQTYKSRVESKDFIIYFVPPGASGQPQLQPLPQPSAP